METLYIYADFDWLDKPELIGRLTYERLRGNGTYGFSFDNDWLKNHSDILISEEVGNFSGFQYSQEEHVFGFVSDTLPDRWGRRLLERKEQTEAIEEKRPKRTLYSYDYLVGIDDFLRMGALRLKKDPDGEFLNSDSRLIVPPLTSIKELTIAAQEYEKSDEANELPEEKWIRQLAHPGTSLGGARPKANVVDEKEHLWIAKFPSRKDVYDMALWEHLCHLLAKEAGINVAETNLIPAGNDGYHALLSKRFDRTDDGKRIHFASAMTMTGLTDGDNHETGHGYLDIVDFIIKGCCDVDENLNELYRRVAFNIFVGNSDDHFRNHGFLLTKKGWTLSPAYDLNPTDSMTQSLLIDNDSNESSLKRLLSACDDYYISSETAEQIISEVTTAIGRWETIAKNLHISNEEMNRFAWRLDNVRLFL
ncbi:MAG: type II toxin-antitoxin system HipA family toxin [Prevotella ruminicola]|uniref:Type II toxin-antitoxin system HipA family toxin n=1 Tax=Xylanibacter ruminicola TaxID=839 RepID=A0A928BRM8_XYLRU|nr:type II toxin-antitoxin system HipA family toxin [Xylanibacter ruminicola]